MSPLRVDGLDPRFVRATVTNFFFWLSINGYVLLPLHVEALGGTEVEIGLIMGLYSAVGIVTQPLIGPWVDALGRRPFVRVGVSLVAASHLLAAGLETLPALAVVRLLQGLGFSAWFVGIFSYVIDVIPPARRGWALGIFGVSGFGATALAPLLGELVIRRFGFRPLFVASLLVALVAAALVWPLRDLRPAGTVTPPLKGTGWLRGGVEEMARLHMVITLFFGLGSGTVFTFLPTFSDRLGVASLALFYTAYAGAAIAVRVLGGRLIDTLGRRTVVVPSMFLQATATAMLAALGLFLPPGGPAPVLPVLFMAGLISGSAHGFLYPGLAALATDLTPPERRAAVVGVFSAMFLVGNAGGAMVFGYVAHAFGYGALWTALTALLLAGASLSVRLPRR